jgi:hypothetical protein
MQRELAAAITEIQDGAQEILDEIDMPPILDDEVYQVYDGVLERATSRPRSCWRSRTWR